MAEAARLRGPDIILRNQPSLSATVEEPLARPPEPPLSASADPADQAKGVSTEITPHERAEGNRTRTAADAANDTVPPNKTADADRDDGTQAKAGDDKTQSGDDDVPTFVLDENGKRVPLPQYTIREITKARNRQREAEAKAADAQKAADEAIGRAKQAQEQFEALQAKAANTNATNDNKTGTGDQPDKDATDPRPTRDQFDDPDAYDEALAGWAEREGIRKAEAKTAAEREAAEKAAQEAKDKAEREAQEAEIARIHADWTARSEVAKTKYEDFEEAITSDKHTVSPAMAQAIFVTDNGPDVAYWLAKNPDESNRIAALKHPFQQVAEIGRISERLAMPVPRARTPRPQPLEPIDGGTSPADTSDQEESMDEVAARVNRRDMSNRRPFIQSDGRRPPVRH